MTKSQIESVLENGKYHCVNVAVKELAHVIGLVIPVCEYKSQALLKLSEVVMLTNKAINSEEIEDEQV